MQTGTFLLGLFITLTIVFASIAVAEYSGASGIARVTSTYVTTSTVIGGTTTLTTFPSSELFEVTFNDSLGCGGYLDKWGVELGNLTITQPPNLSLAAVQANGMFASGKFNLTTITFSVPNGTYPFTIYPTEYLIPASNNPTVGDIHGSGGTITVNGSNVTINTVSLEMCV